MLQDFWLVYMLQDFWLVYDDVARFLACVRLCCKISGLCMIMLQDFWLVYDYVTGFLAGV